MDADLLDALAPLGSEPVEAEPIGRTWRDGRATFRVTLADGRVVKVRRVAARRDKVEVSSALLAELADPALPVPLLVTGLVIVEAWVDGESVADRPLSAVTVEAAADLLVRLHSVDHAVTSTDGELARVEDGLQELAGAGVIASNDAERLRQTARGLPDQAAHGVIHGDLCPSNLVCRPDGTLVSVDNETLRRDFLDYDLGRTWVRWPMPAWAWSRFTDRYETAGRSRPSADAEAAWRVVAAVKSAVLWGRSPDGIGPEQRRGLERVLELAS